VFVAAILVGWFGLRWLDSGVDWVAVEAPAVVHVGETLPMRIQVSGLEAASQVCADLHWASNRESSCGFLASGGTKPVGSAGGSFDFNLQVRPVDGLRYVQGVLFISPTGQWRDHTRVAVTELIPVKGGASVGLPFLARLGVHPVGGSHVPEGYRTPVLFRWLLGLIWCASAVALWFGASPLMGAEAAARPGRGGLRVLPFVLLLTGCWEAFGAGDWVGTQVRAWARAEELYHGRVIFQKVMVCLLFAIAVMVAHRAWGRRRAIHPVLFGFGIYLALTLADLVSLHGLDQWAWRSWHGIPLLGACKMVCAIVLLISILTGPGRHRRLEK